MKQKGLRNFAIEIVRHYKASGSKPVALLQRVMWTPFRCLNKRDQHFGDYSSLNKADKISVAACLTSSREAIRVLASPWYRCM